MEKIDKSVKKDSKKWSFGGFFRKKKKNQESDSSSEEDRKAGFVPQKRKTVTKKNRSSKIIGGFDHIVISPLDKFKETDNLKSSDRVPSIDSNKSNGSIDRRIRRDKAKNRIEVKRNSSSDEDSHTSLNSSSLSRFKSDESLGNNSGSISKKSRIARTDRYLKRLSKDDGFVSPVLTLHSQPQVQYQSRTQPPILQSNIYRAQAVPSNQNHGSTNSMEIYPTHKPRALRNSASLTHVPQAVNGSRSNIPNTRSNNYLNPVNAEVRSLSNDNGVHLSLYSKDIMRNPPVPPPRDPQRRLTVNNPIEARPMSYAFDRLNSSQNFLWKMNNRCVSDDKLWGPQNLSIPTPQRPSSVQPMPQRRFITRHESDSTNNSTINNNKANMQQGYKYMADIAPRSRRPIHIVEDKSFDKPDLTRLRDPQAPAFILPNTNRLDNGVKSPGASASDFWKRIDQEEIMRRTRPVEAIKTTPIKPRSVSTTRAPDMMSFTRLHQPVPIHIDSKDVVDNPPLRRNITNRAITQPMVQNIKYDPPQPPIVSNLMRKEVSIENKSSSMPNYYASQKTFSPPLNKYDEYVARHKTQPNIHFDIKTIPSATNKKNIVKNPNPPPAPPQRSVSKRNSVTEEDITKRQKSANLEDAINELEAIYKSLRLCDEELLDRAEKRDIPTPTTFNTNNRLLSPDYDDDGEEETGEPDIVLDDLVYRNIKHANSNLKREPQPLFGIPIGPIPPPPGTDYLNVQTPEKTKSFICERKSPDLVADDLAFRTLRKDNGLNNGFKLEHYIQPNLLKKKRAMRSMSANIYNLIHRDAAKPNGGHLDDYFALDKALEKAGSLTDLNNDSDNDHPSTLWLLKKNRRQERADMLAAKNAASISSPNSSKGGAVFNLPSTLKTAPTSLPFISRKSPSTTHKPPIPIPRKSVSPDYELMNQNILDRNTTIDDVLAALSREAQATSDKLGQDLIELRKETQSVSTSESPEIQRRTSPISNKKNELVIKKPILCQKIHESTSTLNEIDEVSKAAKLCEDILKEVVKDNKSKQYKKEKKLVIEPEVSRKTPSLNEIKLINDIDDVSNAAKTCERFLVDVITPDLPSLTDNLPPTPYESKRLREKIDKRSNTIGNLVEELKPESKKIGEIANRCIKQLNELEDIQDKNNEKDTRIIAEDEEVCLINFDSPSPNLIPVPKINSVYDGPDYDNLNTDLIDINNIFVSETQQTNVNPDYENLNNRDSITSNDDIETSFPSALQKSVENQITIVQDIDKIIREAVEVIKTSEIVYPQSPLKQSSEEEIDKIMKNAKENITNRDFKTQSSSDFSPHKSSSVTSNRINSSSITSFNAMSSSDYIKSPSSDYQHPSSDCIKSTSTTSYDVKSSSVTPNPNESSRFSSLSNSSPSPLALTPLGECSQYNSSEELAMIFGITPTSPTGKSEDLVCAPDYLPKHGIFNINNNINNNNKNNYNNNHNLNNSIVDTHFEFRGQIKNLDTILESHEEFSNDSICFNKFLFANNNLNNNLLIDQCPDSGNASLSDNPQTPSETNKDYLYKNKIQININNDNQIILSKDTNLQIDKKLDKQCNNLCDEIINSFEQNNNFVKETKNNKIVSRISTNPNDIKLRNRKVDERSNYNNNNKNNNLPGTSTNNNLHKTLTHNINPAHLILACTYGLANNELLSIIAIIIAIITLLAILML